MEKEPSSSTSATSHFLQQSGEGTFVIDLGEINITFSNSLEKEPSSSISVTTT
jgi:hypothetical protein